MFPSKVHPHMFRHSKAMHMLAANIPIVYIRDFLGHEDISTTMIYARADTTLKEAAINKLAPKIICIRWIYLKMTRNRIVILVEQK